MLGYMALMQGVLADIYPTLADVPIPHRRTRHSTAGRKARAAMALAARKRKLMPPCKRPYHCLCQTGNDHAGDRPEVGLRGQGNHQLSAFCGSRSVKELQMNVQAASEPLAPNIIEDLELRNATLTGETPARSFDYYQNPVERPDPLSFMLRLTEPFRPPILYDCWQCEFPQKQGCGNEFRRGYRYGSLPRGGAGTTRRSASSPFSSRTASASSWRSFAASRAPRSASWPSRFPMRASAPSCGSC